MDNSKRGYFLRSGTRTPEPVDDESQDPFANSRGSSLAELSHSRQNLETIFEDAQNLVGTLQDLAPISLQHPLFPSTRKHPELETPDLRTHGIGAMEKIQETLDKLAQTVSNLDILIKNIEKPSTRIPRDKDEEEDDPLDQFLDFDPQELINLTIEYISNPNLKRKTKTRDKEELEILRVVFKYENCVEAHFEDADRRILLKRARFLYTVLTGNWTRERLSTARI